MRAAIEETNGHTGTDGIRFAIPPSDPGYNAESDRYTIAINAALPELTDNVNITGLGETRLTVQRAVLASSDNGAVTNGAGSDGTDIGAYEAPAP